MYFPLWGRRSRLVSLMVTWVLMVGSLRVAAETAPLNVVLILTDDMGAHDLGFTGSRFHETPYLDRLAREGVHFTQAYSACTVCSPTRAALMTGKYPARLKLTDWIAGHDQPKAKLRPPVDWQKELPLGEITLAERAQSAGYRTMHLGKWHLGGEGFSPEKQGFDLNLGGYSRGQPPSYFSPYNIPTLKDGPAGEYLTDREGSEAVKFVTANRDRRFFLNYWPYSVHTPLQAPANLVAKYQSKARTMGGGQTNAIYAAMLESLDTAVGRILAAIEDAGIADRTVVIFTSDNGGLVAGANPPTSNTPLRSGKGSPYEGGIRVPLVIKWPQVTRAGTQCREPVITTDVAATVAAALGGTNALNDGLSLLPVLQNPGATLGRESLAWHYPHYHPGGATPYAAIRTGNWKLIQYYEDGRHELFDLAEDPGEKNDVAQMQPGKVLELARQLFDWQGKVGAQWPMYNPAHEPKPLAQADDGSVLLHSRSAAIHGTTLRYEPMPFKNTLGWWGRMQDWPSWAFQLRQGGDFEVELLQGCGRGSGGSAVDLVVGELKLPFLVEETGHFQNFVPRRLGRISLPAGTHTLSLKPQRKPGGAVMDVRQLRLIPTLKDGPTRPATLGLLAAKKVVFLGDSITYAGEWVDFVETWLRITYPAAEVEFLNLGLPSETVSGLSEPGHAGGSFPRPDAHERLGRVLEKTKPDLIVACYGMNDGIYYPLGDERFKKYRDGIIRLRERAAHEGVRVLHLTPPVFDPLPQAGHTLPAGRDEYRQPYEGYNEVLGRYSEWLVSQRTNGWDVVDIHSPMNRFLAEQRRTDPKFILAGDGVHANTQGHWLIAREFLRHLGAKAELIADDQPGTLLGSHPKGAEILKQVQLRQRALKDTGLTTVGHLRPGMGRGKPPAESQREADAATAAIRALVR